MDVTQAGLMPRSVLLVTPPFCLPGTNAWGHRVGVQAPQQGLAETHSLDLKLQKGRGTGCSSQTLLVQDRPVTMPWFAAEHPAHARIFNTTGAFLEEWSAGSVCAVTGKPGLLPGA